jgi:RNA polymerase sigma-70 factor, ECF subfamily
MSGPYGAILPLIPGLRAYTCSLTGHDLHLADDVVKDTILLALRNWSQLTPGTNLKIWLLQIARNHFYRLRCRGCRIGEICQDDLASLDSVPAEQEQRNELPDFERAFAALSHSHREVLGLIVIQELTYKEAAAVCSCAVGTVRSRMSRARAVLKQTFLGQSRSAESPPTGRADVPLAVAVLSPPFGIEGAAIGCSGSAGPSAPADILQ